MLRHRTASKVSEHSVQPPPAVRGKWLPAGRPAAVPAPPWCAPSPFAAPVSHSAGQPHLLARTDSPLATGSPDSAEPSWLPHSCRQTTRADVHIQPDEPTEGGQRLRARLQWQHLGRHRWLLRQRRQGRQRTGGPAARQQVACCWRLATRSGAAPSATPTPAQKCRQSRSAAMRHSV